MAPNVEKCNSDTKAEQDWWVPADPDPPDALTNTDYTLMCVSTELEARRWIREGVLTMAMVPTTQTKSDGSLVCGVPDDLLLNVVVADRRCVVPMGDPREAVALARALKSVGADVVLKVGAEQRSLFDPHEELERRFREVAASGLSAAARRRERTQIATELLQDDVTMVMVGMSSNIRREAFVQRVNQETGLAKRPLRTRIAGFVGASSFVVDNRALVIYVPSAEHDAVHDVLNVLAQRAEELFARGSVLVEAHNGAVLQVSGPRLVEIVSQYIVFKLHGDSIGCPERVANMVLQRKHWDVLRELRGIASQPFLDLPRGRVVAQDGYDPETQVLVKLGREFPLVPSSPSVEEVDAALKRILCLVAEFPFRTPYDQSRWLALLLTAVARASIRGNVPAFLVRAARPGVGKTKLAQLVGIIATGRRPRMISPPEERRGEIDDAEMRKVLGALVLQSEPFQVFDNVRRWGGSSLNAFLTGEGRFTTRILGHSQVTDFEITTTLAATGINPKLDPETFRRTLMIDLRSADLEPARCEFEIQDIVAHVENHQPELLVDALTLLLAFCRAGYPVSVGSPLGSFEGWDVVRQCVLWLGLPDPLSQPTLLEHEEERLLSFLVSQLVRIRAVGRPNAKTFTSLEREAKHDPNLARMLRDFGGTTKRLSRGTEQLCGRVALGHRFLRAKANSGQVYYVEPIGGEHA